MDRKEVARLIRTSSKPCARNPEYKNNAIVQKKQNKRVWGVGFTRERSRSGFLETPAMDSTKKAGIDIKSEDKKNGRPVAVELSLDSSMKKGAFGGDRWRRAGGSAHGDTTSLEGEFWAARQRYRSHDFGGPRVPNNGFHCTPRWMFDTAQPVYKELLVPNHFLNFLFSLIFHLPFLLSPSSSSFV